MPQIIVPAYHVNRAVLFPRVAGNMLTIAASATLDSHIADFSNGLVGSFQVWWKNTNSIDSEFEIFVSNYTAPDSFGKYPDSKFSMDADCQSLLWNINVLGFRYGFVQYTRGATLTTGDIEIIAISKR